MKRLAFTLALLSACGDNLAAPIDADVDAAVEPCCALLPDQDAVRACITPLPPNTCGVIACPNAGGGFTKINVCGPHTDGGSP